CGVLAFSAIKNNDKVGLILFSDRIERFVPPRKGRRHALRVLRELLYHPTEGKGTDVGAALEYLARVTRRRAVVFLVSDFADRGFEKPLSIAARRHDLVAVRVTDEREDAIPPMGLVEFEDPETGRRLVVNTSSRAFQVRYGKEREGHQRRLTEVLRRSRIDRIDVRTGVPYERSLRRFFEDRARRIRA
ncbi:MAG: VWA domain-containing protein, partial [Gemmatimonadota bacterium]|nr:VWA domain-containing protein [Gemmatimonadota bacterium]